MILYSYRKRLTLKSVKSLALLTALWFATRTFSKRFLGVNMDYDQNSKGSSMHQQDTWGLRQNTFQLVSSLDRCDEARSGFCILYDKFSANMKVDLESLTLVTTGDIAYLHHSSVLCQRWQGPISFAVYSPGKDYNLAKNVIRHLRECHPCVKNWVSWHFLFELENEEELNTPSDWTLPCGEKYVSPGKRTNSRGYEFPINMARNVANEASRTDLVLVSDSELFPSSNFIPRFMKLIRELSSKGVLRKQKNAFVVPLFEITEETETAPYLKDELVHMYDTKKAQQFYKNRCNARPCHGIPRIDGWIRRPVKNISEPYGIFLSATMARSKGTFPWFPLFVGSKRDPVFEESFRGFGLDRVPQIMEMCYSNYTFHILDEPFLVHTPGIPSRLDSGFMAYFQRLKTTATTALQVFKLDRIYEAKYGKNEDCKFVMIDFL